MPCRDVTAFLALAGLIVSSVPSFAFTGIGCPDLPEYDRAIGTIENGPGSCGMTTEEANRILGRTNGGTVAGRSVAVHRAHKKRYRRATPRQ